MPTQELHVLAETHSFNRGEIMSIQSSVDSNIIDHTPARGRVSNRCATVYINIEHAIVEVDSEGRQQVKANVEYEGLELCKIDRNSPAGGTGTHMG